MSNATETPRLVRIATRKELFITGTIVVGRQATCTLVITEGQLSRRHAQLVPEGPKVYVEDLGSTNGTFVNEQRISSKTLLKPGDRVRFDTEEFEFVAPAIEVEMKTVMRPATPLPDGAALAKAAADARALAEAKVAAEAKAAAARSGDAPKSKAPAAWVEGGSSSGAKTQYVQKDEMKKELEKARALKPAVEAMVTMPTLIVAETGQQIPINVGQSETGKWSIGADAERDLVIPGAGVSGLHARLTLKGIHWTLADEMSQNGTFVNGQKILSRNIQSGDRLFFGPVECVFRLPGAAGQAVPRVMPEIRAETPLLVTPIPAPQASKNRLVVMIGVVSFLITLVLIVLAYLFM